MNNRYPLRGSIMHLDPEKLRKNTNQRGRFDRAG
jgi:hypothetical protein